MDIVSIRKKYIPEALNVIFIAEAAPDDPERFFYNVDTTTNDWLYLGLMKALYPKPSSMSTTAYLRTHKAECLKQFQANGYYLIDAIDKRISSSTNLSDRLKLVQSNAGNTIGQLKSLITDYGNDDTKIVLIKKSVYDGLYDRLINEKLPVVNQESIPFPSSGQQRNFADAMHILLARNDPRYRWATRFTMYEEDVIITSPGDIK